MTRSIAWIPKAVVERLHDEQLVRNGGDAGYLNEDRLDAALARPQTIVGYLPDTSLAELAAAIAVGIAKGHPFVDGNKRTAAVVSLMFLRLNSIEISVSEEELERIFVDVAASAMSESELATWFAESGFEADDV